MIPASARICRAAGAALLMLGSCGWASAAESAATPVATSPLVGTLQMLLALGVVLGAIAATAWVLRRMAPGQVGGAGNLRVVAAVAVGPKERVVLVDIGETRLVLGVATGQVNLLHEMPRPTEDDVPQSIPVLPPFVEKLKEMMAARGGNK